MINVKMLTLILCSSSRERKKEAEEERKREGNSKRIRGRETDKSINFLGFILYVPVNIFQCRDGSFWVEPARSRD